MGPIPSFQFQARSELELCLMADQAWFELKQDSSFHKIYLLKALIVDNTMLICCIFKCWAQVENNTNILVDQSTWANLSLEESSPELLEFGLDRSLIYYESEIKHESRLGPTSIHNKLLSTTTVGSCNVRPGSSLKWTSSIRAQDQAFKYGNQVLPSPSWSTLHVCLNLQ